MSSSDDEPLARRTNGSSKFDFHLLYNFTLGRSKLEDWHLARLTTYRSPSTSPSLEFNKAVRRSNYILDLIGTSSAIFRHYIVAQLQSPACSQT